MQKKNSKWFFERSLRVLSRSECEFLVGGGFAYSAHTGVGRHLKDLDVFVRERDLELALRAFADAGYETDISFPHWLGKARLGDDFVDVIHGSGNGVARVDDDWFAHATPGELLGVPVRYCPAEEMIWSKAFVMERERFDGADVLHLIRSCGHMLDWQRLLRRFGNNWPVLFSHLILFGFVYPCERHRIPRDVMEELSNRIQEDSRVTEPDLPVCRGTLLSRAQFQVDVQNWGYRDARMDSAVNMDEQNIAQWTNAVAEESRTYDAEENSTTRGSG